MLKDYHFSSAPQPVPQIQAWFDEFLEEYPHARFGPAHIVVEDNNLENHNLNFCLVRCYEALDRDFTKGVPQYYIHATQELGISEEAYNREMRDTIMLLGKISLVPDNQRYIEDGATNDANTMKTLGLTARELAFLSFIVNGTIKRAVDEFHAVQDPPVAYPPKRIQLQRIKTLRALESKILDLEDEPE